MFGRTLLHLRRNAVAYCALFVATGGTSYAAVSLPANSVTSKQIKKSAVSGPKIKKNAVTAAKIKKNAVTAAKIKADAVDTAKVKDGSLLLKDFAPGQLAAMQSAASAGAVGARGSNGSSNGETGAAGGTGAAGAKGDTGERGATGATGPIGPAGPAGVSSVVVRTDSSDTASASVYCHAGERVVGGGGTSEVPGYSIHESVPLGINGPSSNATVPTGWRVSMIGGTKTYVYVLCAAS
ncbi:MAG: hypothetical protein QOI48_824 [Solirubrobacteraceae bacterium]|jgi:hypothetical protein|nr:hypothetical protein [Solirubrobacteraceae bacterium]